MLKYTNRKVIDSFDWDKLVQKTYGKPYCFQQQDGCQSRGIYNITIPQGNIEDYDYNDDDLPTQVNDERMGVSFKTWLNRDSKEGVLDYFDENKITIDSSSINLFWTRSFYPSLQVIANDLYEKGLIEAGEYIINID